MTANQKRSGSEFWQIFFPAVTLGLIFIGIGVLVILELEPDNTAQLAEVSTIILIIPVLVISLIWFIILGGMIYLVSRLSKALPILTGRILDILEKANNLVKQISAQLTKPVIYPTALLGGLSRLLKQKGQKSNLEG
jgi:hypothetical protein